MRNTRFAALLLAPALLIAPLALCASPSQDQNPNQSEDQPAAPAPAPPSEQVLDMLATKLSLTVDQKNQIAPIIAKRQQDMKALRNNQSLRRMQRARQAKNILEKSDKQINAILTPDQRKQYAAFEQEMRDRGRQYMQQRSSGSSN
jgi:periplasmic protein CpxP/Spy